MIRWDGRLRWTTLDQWWWPGSAPHCWSGVGGGWSTWSATAPSVLCLLWAHTLPARWDTRNYFNIINVVLLRLLFWPSLMCWELSCLGTMCQWSLSTLETLLTTPPSLLTRQHTSQTWRTTWPGTRNSSAGRCLTSVETTTTSSSPLLLLYTRLSMIVTTPPWRRFWWILDQDHITVTLTHWQQSSSASSNICLETSVTSADSLLWKFTNIKHRRNNFQQVNNYSSFHQYSFNYNVFV